MATGALGLRIEDGKLQLLVGHKVAAEVPCYDIQRAANSSVEAVKWNARRTLRNCGFYNSSIDRILAAVEDESAEAIDRACCQAILKKMDWEDGFRADNTKDS